MIISLGKRCIKITDQAQDVRPPRNQAHEPREQPARLRACQAAKTTANARAAVVADWQLWRTGQRADVVGVHVMSVRQAHRRDHVGMMGLHGNCNGNGNRPVVLGMQGIAGDVSAPPKSGSAPGGFAPFLVGNRFLHLFDFGCTLISRASFSVED